MTRKLIEQMLKMIEKPTGVFEDYKAIVTAAREYLAQPGQSEPVAELEFYVDEDGPCLTFAPMHYGHLSNGKHLLYAAPPLREPEQSEPVNQMLLKSAKYVVDVDDDYAKNAPEHRCYVPEAFSDSMEKLRAAIAAAEQAAPLREPEQSEPVAVVELVTQALRAMPDGTWWQQEPQLEIRAIRPVVNGQRLYTAPPPQVHPLREPEQPSLSHLMPSTQERIKEWLADGTFVSRAIGVMGDQEREIVALEKNRAAPPIRELSPEEIDAVLRKVGILANLETLREIAYAILAAARKAP